MTSSGSSPKLPSDWAMSQRYRFSQHLYADLPQNLLDFCATLRLQGFTIGPRETHDALGALSFVDIGSYHQVKHALGLVLCSNPDEEAIFDVLFRRYFLPEPSKQVPPEAQAKRSRGAGGDEDEQAPQARKKAQAAAEPSPVMAEAPGAVAEPDRDEDTEGGGAAVLHARFSPFRSERETPPSLIEEDAAEMERAALILLRRLELGRSRRWAPSARGSRLFFRRTLRRSLQTGGEIFRPAFLGHPRRRPRFVFVLDGSRSMLPYSARLLQFAQALTRHSSRVEVFVFSTGLKRVTPFLRSRADEWLGLGEAYGGGTRIGPSLADFLRRFGAKTLSRDSVVMIASDGLDTAGGESLTRSMRELKRRSAALVWINPLLSSPGYEPTAAGMQAALPFIDAFDGATTAAEFADLAKRIRLRR